MVISDQLYEGPLPHFCSYFAQWDSSGSVLRCHVSWTVLTCLSGDTSALLLPDVQLGDDGGCSSHIVGRALHLLQLQPVGGCATSPRLQCHDVARALLARHEAWLHLTSKTKVPEGWHV